MIRDISRSNVKESDNKQTFEIPKFWYKTKSFEYLESVNLRMNNPIKTSFRAIIDENDALKNIRIIAINVDATRMVL